MNRPHHRDHIAGVRKMVGLFPADAPECNAFWSRVIAAATIAAGAFCLAASFGVFEQ